MKNALIYLGLFFALLGCQHADQANFSREETAAAPSVDGDFDRSASAKTIPADGNAVTAGPAGLPEIPEGKQFIRTADARFKVKEVGRAVTSIQKSLARYGGHLTSKNLGSQVQHSRTVEVSPDSSLLLTLYQLEANLTLRVPNQYLDSLLQDLKTEVLLLDTHTLTAEDVSLQLLEKQLKRRRHEEFVNRLQTALGQKNAQLTDAAKAEEARLEKQLQADAALLAGLQLKDRIEYSTVTLQLYQSPKLSRELVVNPEAANHVKAYEPSFGSKLVAALLSGWEILAWLLLGLVRFWGVFALLGLAWLIFRQLRKWQAQV